MSLEKLCDEKLENLQALCADNAAQAVLKERATILQNTFSQLRSRTLIDEPLCTELLDAMHRFQRLQFLYHAKASTETIAALDEVVSREPHWSALPALEVEPALCKQLAGRLIHSAYQHELGGPFADEYDDGPPLAKDKGMLVVTQYGRGTAEHIASYLLRHDIPMDVDFFDVLFKKILIEHSDESQVTALAHYQLDKRLSAKKEMTIDSRPPQEASAKSPLDPDEKKKELYRKIMKPRAEKIKSGEIFYTLTYIPTPEDAAIDGIPYKDYLKLFCELCDQPYIQIQKANDHLIKRLDKAKTLHIVDEETGTDLTMNIEGKRWANSVVLKNIPGSEVFASPIRESVNGKLVARGRFEYRDGETIENMTLIFKDGRVVDFDAEKGKDSLAKIIEADDGKGEGSRFVGEIGIGTNPWLRRHVINPLLVEKISGSAHIALGDAYSFKTYDGNDVLVDNHNRSDSHVHWDITTMLQGPKSRIVLDEGTLQEEVILRAGQFTDPVLRVLNEGWAALDNKPVYWQKRLAVGGAAMAL